MSARIGFGTTLVDKGTAGSSTNTIAKITDIAVGGLSLATVDATHMGSTDRFQEFIAGLRDAGEVTLTVQSDPVNSGSADGWHHLKDAYEDNAAHIFWLTLPNGTRFTYTALTTNLAIPVPLGDKIVTNVTHKITGKPTWTNP
jgi:hypothetical protein